jgi:general stress protein 26
MIARVIGVALMVAVVDAPAQEAPPSDVEVLNAAREVMERARFATLVTLGADGHPQARIVDAFAPEEDLVVWLGTNAATRKVSEIRADSRVALSYFDPASFAYVTLVGHADLVDDRGERARRWKDEWASLYPGGSQGPEFLLIRVGPERVEVISPARGIVNDPATWLPRIVVLERRP